MPNISARHCEIAIENSRAMLLSRDAHSETLLNGKPIIEARLNDADEVQIGLVTFRVAITRNTEDGSTAMSVERDEC
jgi:predicted component of type VI protein secretion system